MVHGKNRIPYRIDRRLTGLADLTMLLPSRLGCPLSRKTPNMGNTGQERPWQTEEPHRAVVTGLDHALGDSAPLPPRPAPCQRAARWVYALVATPPVVAHAALSGSLNISRSGSKSSSGI